MSEQVQINAEIAHAMAKKIVAHFEGNKRADCEVALLTAYVNVAGGVADYPAETRSTRANLVMELGARALCEVIEQVGAMDDAMFSGSTTCH